ncbi:hypothetical protein AUF78_15275 [archaeon 13_1_20CM_2_51_12]|nr:MAG: hypothetical protein AUF78_15275 [archaeon 13_1_20CM_2_51_12]
MGASRFELEPTPIFSCSSQMELALSHRTRMFLAPDTVGGSKYRLRNPARGIILRKGTEPRIRLSLEPGVVIQKKPDVPGFPGSWSF